MNDQPALQTRWQAIALGQARRQMRIVSTVPVVDVAVAVVISVAVVPGMFIVRAPIVVLVAVAVVTVAVILGYSNRGRKRERQSCSRGGPEPKLQRHCTPPESLLSQ